MTKTEALSLRDRIMKLCRDAGQWVVVSEENKPDLKKVNLEVSIKIDK